MRSKFLIGIISLGLALTLMGCANKGNETGEVKNNKSVQSQSIPTKSEKNNDRIIQATEKDEKKQGVAENKQKNKNEVKVIKEEEKVDTSKFNKKDREWFFIPNDKGIQPEEPKEVLSIIKNKDAYYVGKSDEKVLYLTFDEGYENGYTPKILDTLKKNNVKAMFFVTEPYIKQNKALVKRMVQEGHLVGNHSKSHPSMAKLVRTNKEKFNNEILSTEKTFQQVTGKKMDKFFRPPMGAYNELSLYNTQKLGYKTIFWSFAYKDYEPEKQPSIEYAKNLILKRTHNGEIILLHAISKTNTEILDSLINEWKNKGYNFKTLDML
ncbi:delta-lactam-biosynthetic de-N-acetylase [Clostridium sp. MB40-C1]|uniref:delta-lactam-biosynthetic de-N-acetylase n=1 Tax=Clostridium sp. MB40-C1 TaxID=3070996 RepID=UPI0027E078F0|nr:delta-lactam-biosynthetic de-N-acetylase [Clostridium sp. MB40-C1]WMJ81848.1 delta-lactam-biosynthetic de-N-acetylase [Clostridium sp. MB40-C1]